MVVFRHMFNFFNRHPLLVFITFFYFLCVSLPEDENKSKVDLLTKNSEIFGIANQVDFKIVLPFKEDVLFYKSTWSSFTTGVEISRQYILTAFLKLYILFKQLILDGLFRFLY